MGIILNGFFFLRKNLNWFECTVTTRVTRPNLTDPGGHQADRPTADTNS